MKTKNDTRAQELFGNTAVKKAIWIVTIPSLLTAMMAGLYSFADQIFIQQFVPQTRQVLINNQIGEIASYMTNQSLTFNDYFSLFEKYNQLLPNENLARITANSVVSTTNAAFQPLIIFSNSIVFLVPVGASIYYTKCISKKMELTAKNLWATMFWTTVVLALIATLMSFIFVGAGLLKLLAGKTELDSAKAMALGMSQSEIDNLQDFYNAAHKLSLKWAANYIYIYASGTILQGLSWLFAYFIRAEGYNSFVMWIGIAANLINISLDALFIIVFKMGVLGGIWATIVGWTFNLLAYVIYTAIQHKKGHLWMSLGQLIKFQFSWKMLLPTFLLGFSGFIRSFGVAFSFAIINILLSKPGFADPGHFQFYWAKSAPIITLFAISIFGINDGARSLLAYNYALRNFKRCKEIYLWTLLVAVSYSLIVYVFVFFTANNLWVIALNVNNELIPATSRFIQIMTLRVVAISFSISSLLVFQATNDVEKSILTSMWENFICFAVIMPIGLGLAYWAFLGYNNALAANWIIISTYIVNSLIASLTLLAWSWHYLTKKLPKIDQSKVSWSRKIEHQFFAHAQLVEQKNSQ
ncbi:MATE family efflux transporter [Mycoplasmopsis gallinarum]|uniref:Uncharacterized protein n=1 Tax=Mycoplasmopsis gallinarum TaxID=29557 RepID=A0A168RLJ5_9BACT|nr:MATE family efflux transporter [Mycoplasmopsis gallinarum]OAB49095.1 hypothetical protein MGALLINA_01350 [Mycoplasmopsis gallinarum]